MEKFHVYTYGRPITVQNDHKPLVPIQKKMISKVSMRIQRMLMRLQNYTYEIIYVPGKELHLADTLSRVCAPSNKPGVTFDTIYTVTVHDLTEDELGDLQDATKADTQLQGLYKAKKECPSNISPFWDFKEELTVCSGLIVKGQALLIPKSLRRHYLDLAHQGHQGYDSCVCRIKDSIFTDLKVRVQKCELCAELGPQQQRDTLQQLNTPKKAWSTVSCDIMQLDGKDYLVTVDNLSGYIEVDRLRKMSSNQVILKLRTHFARYGSPQVLITDNGGQFVSQEFAKFASSWRFEHRTSSPHHPRSNGQA